MGSSRPKFRRKEKGQLQSSVSIVQVVSRPRLSFPNTTQGLPMSSSLVGVVEVGVMRGHDVRVSCCGTQRYPWDLLKGEHKKKEGPTLEQRQFYLINRHNVLYSTQHQFWSWLGACSLLLGNYCECVFEGFRNLRQSLSKRKRS